MKVLWEQTLKLWVPSKGEIRRIEKLEEVMAVVDRIKFFYDQEKDSLVNLLNRTHTSIRRDKLSSWDLLNEACVQLSEHKFVCEAHLSQRSPTHYAVELPIAVNGIEHLRYLKFLFKPKLNQPSAEQAIYIDYHEANCQTKVIYE